MICTDHLGDARSKIQNLSYFGDLPINSEFSESVANSCILIIGREGGVAGTCG